MKITQITVSYGATQSLPEYSNIKPQLTLTATVDEGEDPRLVELDLWISAKQAVHEQIDLALEASGKAARYSQEPRYQVLRTYRDYHRSRDAPPEQLFVVVLPNELSLDKAIFGDRWHHAGYSADGRKLRLTHAMQVAAEVVTQDGALLIDCSDGDLSRIPSGGTAPEHLEDTLDYGEQDRTEEEQETEEDDEEYEDGEEPRDFVAEAMARVESKSSDDGPDNSM